MGSEYPPIADYALISDCHAAALVSLAGSIDWCCLPRFDSGACFARLLDWEGGGFCSVEPKDGPTESAFREYVDGTMVLATTFQATGGEARLIDCFTFAGEEEPRGRRRILRFVEGVRGSFGFRIRVVPRFDYGAVDPWMRHHGLGVYSAIGGDDGLMIWSDLPFEAEDRHALSAEGEVRPGERVRLALTSVDPTEVDDEEPPGPGGPDELDKRLDDTIRYWRRWSARAELEGPDAVGAKRSTLALKSLIYLPSGALAAAPTTSLPEARAGGGARNWDYRFSWIRDSALAARSLARLGCEDEAGAFRRFIERSAAGNAKDLQVVFGLGGERRLEEAVLDHLDGYRGAAPVRIGNQAAGQLQLDAFGHLVDQSWRWYERGHEPDDDYWRFLVELVEAAIEHWQEPDAGIWEWRGEPRHFVHSKVLCWVAVDKGLRLAEHCMRKAPERRWRRARDEIREAVEDRGYDADRGIFVQAFGDTRLDASLLRLPTVDFIAYDDERMLRTVDAVRDELELDGLLRRHPGDDGIEGEEGAFLACTFWLTECLAQQGRIEEARATFDRAMTTANDVGLLSEEYDPDAEEMLGNFPQALSHLSHLEAALALAEAEGAAGAPRESAAPG